MVGGGYDPDGLHHQLEVMAGYYLAASIAAIVIGISSWVVATRMRRRIEKDLGRSGDDADLASLETWMKVDEIEEKKNPGRAWAPDSSISDDQSSKRNL
ncbi:MAG TPA: hypothetical protein VFE02_00295 [Candidatus Acidoferrales bacterium]|jgi:hypothetical protein|nr:hypothetical protein [Candidatus Acidoferrales bacterium]